MFWLKTFELFFHLKSTQSLTFSKNFHFLLTNDKLKDCFKNNDILIDNIIGYNKKVKYVEV
jgi:hypothetical protein